MTRIVWTLIAIILAFTITVIVCNISGIQIQDSLITGFIAVMSAELATMGGIKIFKVKNRKVEESRDED